MEEIINWLLEMEQLAGNLYRRVAAKYSGDKEFSSFLSMMAEDEDLHYQLIKNAKQRLLNIEGTIESVISIDQDTKDRNQAPLSDLYERINTHEITKQAIFKAIVNIEYYEFNHIFLYVMNTFKKDEREIQHIAATIQAHKNRVEDFLEKHSDELELSKIIRTLPNIWDKKLLIIDDIESVSMLFSEILAEIGSVETAKNGLEGLEKVKSSFFDVIISDIDMPVLDGLEFFIRAIELDPDIKKHFMFCSGNLTPEIEGLCQEHTLICLEKPVTILKLNNAVQKIIDRNK